MTSIITALEQATDKLLEMTLDSAPKTTPTDTSDIPLVGTATADEDDKESDDEGPIPDMDDYAEDDDPVSHMISHDPHVTSPTPKAVAPATKDVAPPTEEVGIIRTRTYDLNITYDNFYRTPRLWLFGYDERQIPLSEEDTYEDVSQVSWSHDI